MSTQTIVFGAPQRRAEKWRVYRLRTANSTYELEVQTEATPGQRRCAVLTCVAPAERAGATSEDSAPQVEGASLFEASPLEWIGKRLTVGTTQTSPLQSVDFITTASARKAAASVGTQVFGAPASPAPAPAPARQADQPRGWSPFPLGAVEMVEAAASVLQNVCHQTNLPDAIAHDPQLQRRLKLALAQCGMMVEVLEKRG